MATPTIGFIGLGRMGGPMSLRLINAGFDLVVFDTNPDAPAPQKNAGAAVGASSKDVFDSVDLAFVSLPTPDIVEKVVLGGVSQGSRVKTVVDLSTSGPGMATRVSTRPRALRRRMDRCAGLGRRGRRQERDARRHGLRSARDV